MKTYKNLAGALLATILACALCMPALSFATPQPKDVLSTSPNEASIANTAGTCTATIRYYENITYEDPDGEPNEDGRYLMGTHTITGLSEGDVLDAWDYVVDIPGFFFFDGWPGKLTVSSNPDDNVFELIYFREWNSAYTVNYYMMVGADLTADCWSDALAPQGVEFIKFDTEEFEDQPYGKLVEGDAYEYRLDGKYVVDSYPAQIRLGSDTDNNVLNVLYVPDSAHLPDDIEIPDDVFSVEGGAPGGEIGDPGEGTTGSTGGTAGGSSNGTTNGASGSSTSGSSAPALPEDEVIDRDEMIGLLPDGLTDAEINQLFKDFIGSQADAGRLEITDEMLAHPVEKEEALARIAAYNAGVEQRADQGADAESFQTETRACDHLLCIIIMILLLIVAIIGYVLFARERKKANELQEQLQEQASQQQNES